MSLGTRLAIAGCAVVSIVCFYWAITSGVTPLTNLFFAVVFALLALYFWSPRRRRAQLSRREAAKR